MFAIVETGGKQYQVQEGDVLEVELLKKDEISKQNKYTFRNVLLLQEKETHIGQPYVKNAVVEAKVLEELKAPKIIVFKKKSKKQYKRTRGHRQKLHRIQIEMIGIQKAAPVKKTAEPSTKDEPVKKPAAKAVKPKTVKPKASAAKKPAAKPKAPAEKKAPAAKAKTAAAKKSTAPATKSKKATTAKKSAAPTKGKEK